MNERKGAVLGVDGELAAMQSIRRTLNKLDPMARCRVINYFYQAVIDDQVNGAESQNKVELDTVAEPCNTGDVVSHTTVASGAAIS